MDTLRALDLFCGAGGASMGLWLAGFDVVGVDLAPQPNYPFSFTQGNALAYPLDGFDLVWCSPPCQAFTAYKRRPNHVRPRDNLIGATRDRLVQSSALWVIENVPGAPLISPTLLCGSMFDLDVRRHRGFESNFGIPQPACDHAAQLPRFPQATNRKNLRRTVEVGVWRIPLELQRRAMGINWMDLEELSESVPPAYARFIGRAAMRAMRARESAAWSRFVDRRA